jgi:hypothetical protein
MSASDADVYDAAVKDGHYVTMMLKEMTVDSLMPPLDGGSNRDWVSWDRDLYETAIAAGRRVQVNVQINRRRE